MLQIFNKLLLAGATNRVMIKVVHSTLRPNET